MHAATYDRVVLVFFTPAIPREARAPKNECSGCRYIVMPLCGPTCKMGLARIRLNSKLKVPDTLHIPSRHSDQEKVVNHPQAVKSEINNVLKITLLTTKDEMKYVH